MGADRHATRVLSEDIRRQWPCDQRPRNKRPNADYQGLFGYLGGPGIINDLTVRGSVDGRYNVGGLAGTSEGYGSATVFQEHVPVTVILGGEYENPSAVAGWRQFRRDQRFITATGSCYGIYGVGGLIGL